MKGFLTQAQRLELKEELRLERYARYSDRIKCILLLDQGKSEKSIAEYLFLSLGSIVNYRKRYESGGIEGLVIDDYCGSECRLTEVQQEELSKHLEESLYATVAEIKLEVKARYDIEYSSNGLRHLLKRLGFVYKKPKVVPGKADREKQEEFLQVLESKLAEDPENTAIYYADGVHPQHNTHCSYGWIKRGQAKQIKTNTGRKRVNLNGLVNANDPTDVIIEESASVNAQSTIAMLKKLEKQCPDLDKIYVVADNARYYRAKLVKEFLATSKIEILFLPPYSPNLNLIERLWKFLKKIVLYNQYYEKFSDFRSAVLKFFDNIEQYKEQLESLMTLRFHTVQA